MTHPLVAAARRYIGRPFRHRGRGPRYYDCAGVCICASADIGHVVQDLAHYGREPHKDGLREQVRLNMGPPITGALQPGDIPLMRFERYPHHLGIIGDYGDGGLSLIHAYAEVGYVCEHRLDAVWQSRIIEAYRWHA